MVRVVLYRIPFVSVRRINETRKEVSKTAYILFISNLRPFSKGVPKKDPNLKQIRTERTLAESRVVLI